MRMAKGNHAVPPAGSDARGAPARRVVEGGGVEMAAEHGEGTKARHSAAHAWPTQPDHLGGVGLVVPGLALRALVRVVQPAMAMRRAMSERATAPYMRYWGSAIEGEGPRTR